MGFITVHNNECGGTWLPEVRFVYLQGKIKVMTVNPTLNNHLLLINKLKHLFDLEYLSKDELDDYIICVTLHRQLEFKQLTINK
jgi:hypothetical protein